MTDNNKKYADNITKFELTVRIDLNSETCTIEEDGAEAESYDICADSLESIAWSVGEHVSDYLQGLV